MTAQVAKVDVSDSHVSVTWGDGPQSKFDNIFLRDHCQCDKHFHSVTKQRTQNTFEIPRDVRGQEASVAGDGITVKWAHDGHESTYSGEWLRLHSYDPVFSKERQDNTPKVPQTFWVKTDVEGKLPTVEYKAVMEGDIPGVQEWTRKLYEYGFCMISGVPTSPEATEKLVERLAYIRHTHYGGFWDFTADMAKADLAYSNYHLACHTDGTYWTEAPGLQLFHLLHHDGTGGETMLADAFKLAELLKKKFPQHYETLSTIRVPAHSAGEETTCISQAIEEPIFVHDPVTKELVKVRWNNDDRSVMDKWDNPEDVVKFYDAIREWVRLIEENEVVIKLQPGTCLIFDNWRVMHGRKAFTGSRRMCGAYVARDDYISRVRLLNLGREAVLKKL
uniref:Trimethyllysine dioxygenase n=1 Tax=Blastobotrys adeninivorans TaxID=409370 RepID=A0A060T364_BLAAD